MMGTPLRNQSSAASCVPLCDDDAAPAGSCSARASQLEAAAPVLLCESIAGFRPVLINPFTV